MFQWEVGEVIVADKDYTKALKGALEEAEKHSRIVKVTFGAELSRLVFDVDWNYKGWVPDLRREPVKLYRPVTDHSWE